jgi:hypothetical protein
MATIFQICAAGNGVYLEEDKIAEVGVNLHVAEV